MSAAIAEAVAEMHEAEAQRLAETAADRSRRHLVRLLDWAIGVCEEVNLGHRPADDPSLRTVMMLVEQLSDIAGRKRRPAASASDALEQLFELQESYLTAVPNADERLTQAMEAARRVAPSELEREAERIAGAAGISLQVLRAPGRTREVVRVRRLVARHLRSRGCSLPAIGEVLDRDHSSVINLLRASAGVPR